MIRPVVAILGPTASGKSELAQHVALRLNGEVVSADSMQVYKGMDIGTAKIPRSKMLVPHHLIDILDPGEAFRLSCSKAYPVLVFLIFRIVARYRSYVVEPACMCSLRLRI